MPHKLQDNNTSRRCIQRKDDEEEIYLIQAIEHAKSFLQVIKIALMDKQQAMNEDPSISACVDELEAVLQTIDFASSSIINDELALLAQELARVPKKTKVEKETIKERKSDAVVEKEANVGANEKVVA